STSNRWSRVEAQDGPNHFPTRYEDTWVRDSTSGSTPGSCTSVCVITTSPVATSIGSPVVARAPAGVDVSTGSVTPSRIAGVPLPSVLPGRPGPAPAPPGPLDPPPPAGTMPYRPGRPRLIAWAVL